MKCSSLSLLFDLSFYGYLYGLEKQWQALSLMLEQLIVRLPNV